MEIEKELNFQLGQITAQIKALNERFTWICERFSSMEIRLLGGEQKLTELGVKMALLGVISGGVGSVFVSFLLKRYVWN